MTTTVHHDAVYRDEVIHHDAVTEGREVCTGCGNYGVGGKLPSCSCSDDVDIIHQVVTIKKAYDEKTKVLVTEAYDEEVGTGEYKCSICGTVK